MKCDECLLLIEEYLDNELQQTAAESVAAHLEQCRDCAGAMEKLRLENEWYQAQAPALHVPAHLWTRVRASIASNETAETANPLWSKFKQAFSIPVNAWATAVLILAAIGLTVAFMSYFRPSDNPQPIVVNPPPGEAVPVNSPDSKGAPTEEPVRTADTREPKTKTKFASERRTTRKSAAPVTIADGTKSPHQLVREAEQKYLAAIAMLSRNAARERSRMDADTRTRLDQALINIDRTIASTRKVVRQHPDDPVAVQYMLTAYARKVDVLREMLSAQ
jgi:hypothetical protein